jgi:hypothetical protein
MIIFIIAKIEMKCVQLMCYVCTLSLSLSVLPIEVIEFNLNIKIKCTSMQEWKDC